MTTVELSDVAAGTGGFVINGVSSNDFSGKTVSGAGDVNGDGRADLIVGAYRDDPNGTNSGASFVVFGKTDGTAVELSAVEAGTGGFVINGVSSDDFSSISVSSAGDVNGDGMADLIIGAYGDDPNANGAGASFVVFGKTGGTAVQLSDVAANAGGFVINGVSSDDRAGISVSGAGDVDGDGKADLIVGAFQDDPNGAASGASFVVFGKTNSTPTPTPESTPTVVPGIITVTDSTPTVTATVTPSGQPGIDQTITNTSSTTGGPRTWWKTRATRTW